MKNCKSLGNILTILLFAGFLLALAGQQWALHESSSVVSSSYVEEIVSDDITLERMEQITNDMLTFQSRLHRANLIKLLGICLFGPAYLALLLICRNYSHASFVLKTFVWMFVLLFCAAGVNAAIHGELAGLLTLPAGAILAFPNRMLAKKRGFLVGYAILLTGILILWFVFVTSLGCCSSGYPNSSFLLMTALWVTVFSAATLSPWLVYLRETPDRRMIRYGYVYRWCIVVLLALLYSTYAISTGVALLSPQKDQKQLVEQIEKSRHLLNSLRPDSQPSTDDD